MYVDCVRVWARDNCSVLSNSANTWAGACRNPLSMKFSRQEYQSGLWSPSPGDLPKPGFETGSPTLQGASLPSEPQRNLGQCQAGWLTSWNQDCQEKYQQLQICRWYHSNAESEQELKSLFIRVKEESEKAGLKLNIQNTKIMASGPITSWEIDGKQWKQWQTLFSWALKSLQMVTAAMKLKDACSLEEMLWHTCCR